jgi:tetratricopeptide (TPR) repeat protein
MGKWDKYAVEDTVVAEGGSKWDKYAVEETVTETPAKQTINETVTDIPAESSIPTVTMDANDGLVPEGSGEFDIKNPTKATGVINIPKGGVTSVALQVEQDKLANNQSEYVKNAKNEIRKLAINTDFSAPAVDPMEGQQQQLIEGGSPDAAVAPKVTDYEQALNYIINPENTPENQIQLSDTDKEDLAKYAQVAAQSAPAIQQLSKQLEQNPDDVKTLNDLGEVLLHAEDTSQALSFFSKANAIQENGQSLMGLGNTYLKAGDYSNAEVAFWDAWTKDSNPDAAIKAMYAGIVNPDYTESAGEIIGHDIDKFTKKYPDYSYLYALSAYNKEKYGDKEGAAVDNATYELLRQQELLPESVNADDPNSDYAKERASQAARLGAIHDAIAAPINFFGKMEMGTIEGGIHGLKNFVEGLAGTLMGGDKIGSILNIFNGAAETVFSGAMLGIAPGSAGGVRAIGVNAGFHMLPESVNKVLMQPLNVIGNLSDTEVAELSKNQQAMLALGNTIGSIAILGAVHKGPKKFTEKENNAILSIVKGEAIDSEGLSLKQIVDKAKKVLEESKLTDFQDAEKVWTSIPKELSTQDKLVVAPDLIKRERLQEEMAKASPAFKNYFKEKIDKVDEDINAKLSINLGLKEQAAEKTKSAEAPPKTITNETVKTSKVEEGSGSKQAEVIRKDEVGQEVLIPEYSEKLKDVSPETKVVDLPHGLSVEFNGEKGTIGRSETSETLFINAEGKETIVGGGGDVSTLAEKGISRTEGTYSDKRGDYYVKDGRVFEVTKDGLKPVYEGEKANVERKEAIIRKALNPEKPKVVEQKTSNELSVINKKDVIELTEDSPELNTIEHDLKNGDKVTANIFGKKVEGTVTGVGKHKDQIVIDFKDVDGNERFIYAHQIENIESAAPKVENITIAQKNRIKELLSQNELSAENLNELKALTDIRDGKQNQLPPKEIKVVSDTPSSRPIEKFESGVAFEEAGSGHNVLFTDKDGKKSVVGKVFGTEGKTGAEFDSWVKPQLEAIHYKEVVKAVERGDVVPKEVLDHYLSSKIEGDYNGMLAEAIKSVKENGPKKEIFSEQEIGEVMDKRAEELSQMKRTKDYVFQLIHDNFGGITEAQWNRFGDANWLKGKEGKKFRKKYIKNDAGKTDTNDFGSFSLSSGEGSSIEITPQNVVDYIMDRELNPKKYDGRLKQWNDAASIPKKDVPSLLSGDDAMVLSIAESNRGLGMTDLEVDTIKRYVESKAKNEARAKNTKPRSAEGAPKSPGAAPKSERVGRKPGEKAQKKKDEAKSINAEESKYVEAEKKLTKIFDTLRAKLIADLPEGTKKSGVGAKEVLDAAEKIVKAALKAGEAIEIAVKKGRDYLKANWEKGFGKFPVELEVKENAFPNSKVKEFVYHGSDTPFESFKDGQVTWFSESTDQANHFGQQGGRHAVYKRGKKVLHNPFLYKSKINLESLLEIGDVGNDVSLREILVKNGYPKEKIEKIISDAYELSEEVKKQDIEAAKAVRKGKEYQKFNSDETGTIFSLSKNPKEERQNRAYAWMDATHVVEALKKNGIDGVIAKEGDHKTFAVFDPKNIEIVERTDRDKTEPTRYLAAEKSVKTVFNTLREKLKSNAPEGTQKMGLGMEDLLNAAEKVIIGAIRAGEKIDVAISKGLDHLKEKWDDSFGEFPEKELRDILKENGEIQLSHEKTDALREKYGMEEREINDPVSTEKTRAEAQKIIKKGFDVIKLANEVIKKERTITPVERAILAERVAILDKELLEGDTTSPEYAKKMEEQNKLIKASEISASQAGSSLGSIAHIKVVADESLSGYFQEQRRVNKEGALTEKQTATNKKEFEEITKVKEAYEKRIAKIQEENNRLKAEKEVEKLTKKASKRTAKEKLDEDFDALAKEFAIVSRSTLSSGGPIQATGIILKMVKNRVEKGVITLSEVVDAVHDKVGEFGISKEDIIAAIAGKSGVERTRSEVAKNGYELKQEARLVQKLMDLQNGKEPSSERGKIQKNARLEELRKQIKEHDLTKTAEYKKRLDAQIAEVERELATGDFAKEEKAEPLKLDKETLELQDKYMQLSMEREARLLKEEYAQRSMGEKAGDIGMSLLNAPMTLMSSGDLSAVLRQGLVASTSHPILAARASKQMLKFFKSQKDFDRWHFETKNDPRYLAAKEAGLAIVDPHDPKLAAREEAFMGNIIEKIPLYGSGIRLAKIKDGKLVRTEGEYGGLVKASERAYVGFLNKMRWDVYNQFAERLQANGITYENNPTLYKKLANYVNDSTGRGNVSKGIERLSPALNAAFFSPRLWASRLKLLSNWANPWWYKNVPAEVRRFYWEDMGKFTATVATAFFLAKMNGQQVETDIRSSDFLKIRDGKKRYDILGGFQQPIRTLGQYAWAQKKDIESGEITKLADENKSLPNRLLEKDRLAVLLQHIRGKLSPVPAAFTDFGMGRMMDYSEPTVEKEAVRMMVPLAWQDIYAAYGEEGAKSFLTTGVPTMLGISSSTYKDRPKEETKEKPDKPKKPKKKKRDGSGFN